MQAVEVTRTRTKNLGYHARIEFRVVKTDVVDVAIEVGRSVRTDLDVSSSGRADRGRTTPVGSGSIDVKLCATRVSTIGNRHRNMMPGTVGEPRASGYAGSAEIDLGGSP